MKQRGATPEEDEALGLVQHGPITNVQGDRDKGWTIEQSNGWTCNLKGEFDVDPKVGDDFTVYGQIGYSFHGQALNGEVLWYKTIEQEEAERQAWLANYEAEKRQRFADNLAQMDADYMELPDAFKRRIDRFRAKADDFRWESEPYEMFCCMQAVILAKWAMEDGATPDQAIEKIDAWNSINSKENDPPYDYKAQAEAAPTGWSDQHSGNTHGGAISLAKHYILGHDL